jgi:hypothetical protein
MHGQNHSGGIGQSANAARNSNAYSNPARIGCAEPSRNVSHRHISVVGEEFAVSSDGMEMFGVLDLEAGFEGCRFAIGIRNANNKRFRLACTVGLRVFVCHNLAFRGDYTPVLAKHSKRFSLEDALSIGVDRMQRNFDPMRQQVEHWRAQQLSAEAAKLTIYRAFIEGDLGVPKHTSPEKYTNSISIPSTRSSSLERRGACQTRSPHHSRNSTRFHGLRPLPSWVVSWGHSFPGRSNLAYGAVSADRLIYLIH